MFVKINARLFAVWMNIRNIEDRKLRTWNGYQILRRAGGLHFFTKEEVNRTAGKSRITKCLTHIETLFLFQCFT